MLTKSPAQSRYVIGQVELASPRRIHVRKLKTASSLGNACSMLLNEKRRSSRLRKLPREKKRAGSERELSTETGMDKLNVGIIGTGWPGQMHAQALGAVDGAKLYACADVDDE